MPRTSGNNKPPTKRHPPATTVEARENQLIALAVDVAEEQLINRTASSQVITHFLKLGTTLAGLEKVKLEHENELLKAKTDSIKDSRNSNIDYKRVIRAIRCYRGEEEDEEGENDD